MKKEQGKGREKTNSNGGGKNQPAQDNKPAKRKCGSKPASLELNTTATSADISRIMSNNLYWYNRDIVKTDEECAERLNEFFARITETGEIPTVEKMCLALGTVRRTVYDWECGSRGPVRAHIIKKAKEILAALDAELVSSGLIPQVTYIFRAKNFFGLRDVKEVEIEARNTFEPVSEEDLKARIESAVIDV